MGAGSTAGSSRSTRWSWCWIGPCTRAWPRRGPTPVGVDCACPPSRSSTGQRSETRQVSIGHSPGAQPLPESDTATSTFDAGHRRPWAPIRTGRAHGEYMTSWAMDGNGRRRRSNPSGIRAVDSRLRGVFGRLLRRQALRAEGRFVGDVRGPRAPERPQLVPGPLSICLRQIPLRLQPSYRRNPMRLLALLALACLGLAPLPAWAQTFKVGAVV